MRYDIAFRVSSGVDSQMILDRTGAETLIGRGDMLYLARKPRCPTRMQGCYVSEREVEAIIEFIRGQRHVGTAVFPDMGL